MILPAVRERLEAVLRHVAMEGALAALRSGASHIHDWQVALARENHGRSAGKRFKRGNRQSLADRGQGKEIRASEQVKLLLARHQPGSDDAICQIRRRDAVSEPS